MKNQYYIHYYQQQSRAQPRLQVDILLRLRDVDVVAQNLFGTFGMVEPDKRVCALKILVLRKGLHFF